MSGNALGRRGGKHCHGVGAGFIFRQFSLENCRIESHGAVKIGGRDFRPNSEIFWFKRHRDISLLDFERSRYSHSPPDSIVPREIRHVNARIPSRHDL